MCLVTSACNESSVSGFVGLQLAIFFGVPPVGGSQQRKLSEKIACLASACQETWFKGSSFFIRARSCAFSNQKLEVQCWHIECGQEKALPGMLMWCPMELIGKMLSLQPELNWILAVSYNASTWQVPISTNVAFKKLIPFPGTATLPLGAAVHSRIFHVLGLSSLQAVVFLVCLHWLWRDPMPGWSFLFFHFSVQLWNQKSTFLGS